MDVCMCSKWSGSSSLCRLIRGMAASSAIGGLLEVALAQVYKCMIQQPKNATCHGMKRKISIKIRHIDTSVLFEVVPMFPRPGRLYTSRQ